MKEVQPRASFARMGVAARTTTDLVLSGGETIPYIYSLSVRSTVPYVKYLGSGSSQKVFSWNEQIVVKPGELVTVRNDSFHRGDIIINSGVDAAALPSRVTVPVAWRVVGPTLYVADGGLDTRRARRAFLSGVFFTGAVTPGSISWDLVGKEASYQANQALTAPPDNGPVIQQTRTVPPSTQQGLIPLGMNADPSDTVHALLDTIQNVAFDPTVFILGAGAGALFVLEYA